MTADINAINNSASQLLETKREICDILSELYSIRTALLKLSDDDIKLFSGMLREIGRNIRKLEDTLRALGLMNTALRNISGIYQRTEKKSIVYGEGLKISIRYPFRILRVGGGNRLGIDIE